MAPTRRLWRIPAVLALLLALGACGGKEEASFAGHWTSSQWGEHYILVENSTMKIIYTHDDGRVFGTVDGTTFTGWWTESPSRRPSTDAGDVTFKLTGTGDKRTVDGTWRYGQDGNPRENWDLTWVDAQIPPEIQAKFHDPALFIAHPA